MHCFVAASFTRLEVPECLLGLWQILMTRCCALLRAGFPSPMDEWMKANAVLMEGCEDRWLGIYAPDSRLS